MKLTIRQRAFADCYLELGNVADAAIKAGYSKNYAMAHACKLLKHPGIKELIEKRLKEIEDKRIADASEVLKYLTSVLRGESTSEVVVIEGEGMGVSTAKKVEKAPDEKERLRAAELLAKRYGLLNENINLNASVGVQIIDDIGGLDE